MYGEVGDGRFRAVVRRFVAVPRRSRHRIMKMRDTGRFITDAEIRERYREIQEQ
jgi:hypothetical protein